MAKVIVFRGSPRKEGNTNALEKVIRQQLLEAGHEVRLFDLYDMDIRPCTACRYCQQDWTQITCSQSDDMDEIFREIVDTDLLFDQIKIDASVAAREKDPVVTKEDGRTIFTYVYKYDGCAFYIEADVQAIQGHNAQQAIESQWCHDIEATYDLDSDSGSLKAKE